MQDAYWDGTFFGKSGGWLDIIDAHAPNMPQQISVDWLADFVGSINDLWPSFFEMLDKIHPFW